MKIQKILNEVLDFNEIAGQFKEVSKHLIKNQKDSNSLQTDLETFLRNLKAAADIDAASDKQKDDKIAALEKQMEAFRQNLTPKQEAGVGGVHSSGIGSSTSILPKA